MYIPRKYIPTIMLIVISASMILGIAFSCSDKKRSEQEPKEKPLGEYVYLDDGDILHTDKKCRAIYTTHGAKPVFPVETKDVIKDGYNKYCSVCVSEQDIIYLKKRNPNP